MQRTADLKGFYDQTSLFSFHRKVGHLEFSKMSICKNILKELSTLLVIPFKTSTKTILLYENTFKGCSYFWSFRIFIFQKYWIIIAIQKLLFIFTYLAAEFQCS